jgi:arylsulfatase A-like enzyme
MKRLRRLHLYLRCLFAPMLILFAATGVAQRFGSRLGILTAGSQPHPAGAHGVANNSIATGQRRAKHPPNKPTMHPNRLSVPGLFAGVPRLIGTLAVLAATLGLSTQAATPPNILFIFSDDHAYQAISAYGDGRKLLNTPGIDRLAREGIRFDRCLVPNSICGPVRATVLTGKYSHKNGFYNNANSRFDGAQTTFPKLLQAAGYQTALVGKWHLVSDPTGFDFWQILPGQGVYYNPPMVRNGERVKLDGYVTDLITDVSLDWLQRRDKTRPFLLMAQHKAPHREWEPALRHLGHDGDRRYAEPKTLFDDYAGRGLAERDQDMTIAATMTDRDLKLVVPGQLTPAQRQAWDAYYEPRNAAFRAAKPAGKELVRWKYQRYLHDYLGCLKAVDESVARLLEYLDTEGLAENTIVVYSSDQGFYLGEHGWFDKRWIFEESLRTPFLLRWPAVVKPGRVNRDLVSVLDYGETFLEAAGLPVPAEMQGRSLLPILQGRTPKDWRASFYYQYFEWPQPHRVRPHYGVVTDRYKLVRFRAEDCDYWELFDLKKDPQELRSVFGERGYAKVQRQLEAELNRLRAEYQVPAQDPPEASGRALTARPAAAR